MKKLISFALSLVMLLSCVITASAALTWRGEYNECDAAYKNGYTSTVPQAIENFLNDAAKLNMDRPLFIVSHQPLFDNRNDNGWAEDWFNAIYEVATEMDVAFFYGHNHKYDSGSDYYYAKGSTMPVATRKLTNGKDWNFDYQVGSGYKYNYESEDKTGTPWLSKIPWIGERLFGNTNDDLKMNEMLLVVTVDWAIDDASEGAAVRMNEMKDRKVEVEMP